MNREGGREGGRMMRRKKKKKDIGRKREDKKIKTAEQEGKLSKTRPNEKDE